MVTSGTSSFNPAATLIINMAYRKLGAIAEDETPTAGMYSDAAFQLNGLIKEWMATGIHVWTEEEAILFLQQGQYRYLLGGTTTDNCCDANSYVLAQLSQAANAGANTVTLVTTLGITNGQFFGVVLDSGFVFWTTVSATPANSTVHLAAPLPGIASPQQFAFAYTTKIVRPLKVPNARLLTYQGLEETPMDDMSRQEYMDQPNKANLGTPTQFFYAPKLVSGEMYVWPNVQQGIWGQRFTWYRPLQDINSPANTADFPQEWVNTLGWNLAKEMGPEFDVPPNRWAIILQQAKEKLDMVTNWDRESEPILFQLDMNER